MAHNKKRNTAFLFESLMREGTKAAIEKDIKKATFIKTTILNYFNSSTEMGKELNLYKSLRVENIDSNFADRIIGEAKSRHDKLDKRKLFNEKTSLINTINKTLGHNFYNTFIPNYKNIATIAQIFNDQTPIKEKILLENSIIEEVKKINENKNSSLQHVDKIVYKTFTKRFNEKYSSLLSEQKDLLTKYVGSFSDDGLELKIFLNEEIERLKEGISEAVLTDEIKSDKEMYKKTAQLQDFLDEFKNTKQISNEMLETVLKIQQFVHEVKSNA